MLWAAAGPGAALTIAVDDTLFKRSGKKVFGVAWHHDGAAKGPKPIGFGNCWVVARPPLPSGEPTHGGAAAAEGLIAAVVVVRLKLCRQHGLKVAGAALADLDPLGTD